MMHGYILGLLHEIVGWLLYPVIAALAVAVLVLLWELGHATAECFGGLKRWASLDKRQTSEATFEHYAMKRLERVDLLARSGPILGLMGTLIPLGPGLSAMSQGHLDQLATAITVAFDTTVIGLLVGLLGFLLGRIRRRWYEAVYRQFDVQGNGDE